MSLTTGTCEHSFTKNKESKFQIMKPHIGISEQHLAEISQLLSHVLADEFVLYTRTLNAHWNLEGPDFHSMHLLFKSQYNELAEIVDTIAELIILLGNYPPAT